MYPPNSDYTLQSALIQSIPYLKKTITKKTMIMMPCPVHEVTYCRGIYLRIKKSKLAAMHIISDVTMCPDGG